MLLEEQHYYNLIQIKSQYPETDYFIIIAELFFREGENVSKD